MLIIEKRCALAIKMFGAQSNYNYNYNYLTNEVRVRQGNIGRRRKEEKVDDKNTYVHTLL
jgi:hypothetical protein